VLNPIAQELSVEFEFLKLPFKNSNLLPIATAHENPLLSLRREKFAPNANWFPTRTIRKDNHIWLKVIDLYIQQPFRQVLDVGVVLRIGGGLSQGVDAK
jgi:hypothetical protein